MDRIENGPRPSLNSILGRKPFPNVRIVREEFDPGPMPTSVEGLLSEGDEVRRFLSRLPGIREELRLERIRRGESRPGDIEFDPLFSGGSVSEKNKTHGMNP